MGPPAFTPGHRGTLRVQFRCRCAQRQRDCESGRREHTRADNAIAGFYCFNKRKRLGRGCRAGLTHRPGLLRVLRALRVSGSKFWGDSRARSKSRSLSDYLTNAQRGIQSTHAFKPFNRGARGVREGRSGAETSGLPNGVEACFVSSPSQQNAPSCDQSCSRTLAGAAALTGLRESISTAEAGSGTILTALKQTHHDAL